MIFRADDELKDGAQRRRYAVAQSAILDFDDRSKSRSAMRFDGEVCRVTIEQADKIDGMGVEKGTEKVVLMISDHLDWLDAAAHLEALERKVNAYLDFISSQQILEQIPDARSAIQNIDLSRAS